MSPVDILDGPLGLEAMHAVGGVTLNDRTVDPRTAIRYYVDHIGGLHDMPEKDDNRGPRTGRIGEVIYSGQLRGKNVTYEGRVQAPTLQLLRRGVRAARGAFATESDLTVSIEPQAAYGALTWAYGGRPAAWVCDDNQQDFPADTLPTPYQRKFTLTIRMDDPRFYLQPPHVAGPFPAGQTVDVLNAGDIDSELHIWGTYDGSGSDVYFYNETAGGIVWLTRMESKMSESLDFYTYDRSILLDGSPDPTVYDNVRSTWWSEELPALAPGTSTIQVGGGLDNWYISWSDATV